MTDDTNCDMEPGCQCVDCRECRCMSCIMGEGVCERLGDGWEQCGFCEDLYRTESGCHNYPECSE